MTTGAAGLLDLEIELESSLKRHLAGVPPNLAESIRYSLLAPGKRIRPRLLLASASMLGVPREAALPAALALEMVHCFTLIHDDLPCMDDDDFRRGRPSNHKKFGEAAALLAGDALMALALDSFAEAAPHAGGERFAAALRRLSRAMGPRGVIGGQAAEMLLAAGSPLSELETMHALKTGALFEASILVPRDLAGVDEASAEGRALDRFARELGLAFQVADDLEDAAQDGARDGAQADPTSILAHLSPKQAAAGTSERLRGAIDALKQAFGARADALATIGAEVLAKFGAYR